MEEFGETLLQNKRVIIILLSVIIAFLVFYIYRIRQRTKRVVYENDSVPANFWFYSCLVNMQIGIEKVSQEKLMDYFYHYLHKKYHIRKDDLALKTVFDLVGEREERLNFIELYGKIWNDINDLEGKSEPEIIAYIKSIKLLFNKEDVDSWISATKFVRDSKCNNC